MVTTKEAIHLGYRPSLKRTLWQFRQPLTGIKAQGTKFEKYQQEIDWYRHI